jgi:hypothetical protein
MLMDVIGRDRLAVAGRSMGRGGAAFHGSRSAARTSCTGALSSASPGVPHCVQAAVGRARSPYGRVNRFEPYRVIDREKCVIRGQLLIRLPRARRHIRHI